GRVARAARGYRPRGDDLLRHSAREARNEARWVPGGDSRLWECGLVGGLADASGGLQDRRLSGYWRRTVQRERLRCAQSGGLGVHAEEAFARISGWRSENERARCAVPTVRDCYSRGDREPDHAE